MPAKTAATTVAELAPANAERTAVRVINAGTADEAVRVDTDTELVKTSANIIYNRDDITFKGPIAKKRIFFASDSGTPTVNYTEVF